MYSTLIMTYEILCYLFSLYNISFNRLCLDFTQIYGVKEEIKRLHK